MSLLLNSFHEFLGLLLKHDVDFMIVGGYAVIFHGYERTTNDLDLWLRPSNENKAKLSYALREYGVDPEDLEQLSFIDFTQTNFFFFGKEPNRIDFLTKINNVEFKEAIQKAIYAELGDVKVPILDLENLILSKITSKRPQDRADVDMLQKITKHNGSS